MAPLKIEMEVVIARPVSEVFAAWTTADALASWFAPMAVSTPAVALDFVENGSYSIEMRLPDDAVFVTRGEFREIEPEKKIVMTWHCSAFPDPESLVTVTFEPVTGGTRLILLHERFRTEETCENHRHGWEACLAALEQYVCQ